MVRQSLDNILKNIRIIPRLDIKGPNLIKSIQFDGHRVLGTAEEFAEIYYKEGVDELIYQDLEDLKRSATIGNPKITSFEDSVFTGNYRVGNITKDFLKNLENTRSNLSK